ncbi:MAG: SemiSWEET family transporter [archaeon]
MQTNTGFHHYNIRKRIHKKYEPYPHPDKLKRIFDKIIYIAVILGPIMNLPQLYKIWHYKEAAGVSFISWASFSVGSATWLLYGLLHKDKPILIMNSFLIIIQVLIAIGAFLYK